MDEIVLYTYEAVSVYADEIRAAARAVYHPLLVAVVETLALRHAVQLTLVRRSGIWQPPA